MNKLLLMRLRFSLLCTDLHQVGDGRQHHRHPGAQQGDQGRGKPAGDAVDAIDETIPRFVGKIVTSYLGPIFTNID